MTYAPHHRITLSGTFAANGGALGEIWATSVASSDTMTDAALAAAVVSACEGWFHSTDAHAPAWANLTKITVESILATGRVASSFSVDADAVGSTVGQGGPAICSFAFTLETAAANAHGGTIRGRMFPPNSGWYSYSNAFTGGSGIESNIATSGKELIEALNTAGAVCCVASQVGGGVNATVTAVSADGVVDTQRRRKNHTKTARSTANL